MPAFQNAVPGSPSMAGVAPLQVQAGRLTSKPACVAVPWYANSPTWTLPKHAAARCVRGTGDECRDCPSSAVVACGRGGGGEGVPALCADMVRRWGLLFLDTSSRLPANQAHRVCANGLPTPNGFSSPQPVSPRCSVLLLFSHDDSAATSTIHGPALLRPRSPPGPQRRPLPPQPLEPPSRDIDTTSGPTPLHRTRHPDSHLRR
ncbi:hypothetical protein G6011_08879 [Alternaria panax]|uniref:Uncharacterized protein n=1 Tax=Alternaria panax TaxID=48097 RepID=A0AAD4NLP6_9PLEO|nr:hypothetical protein G6011_08879 [Alternaria panax]